MTTESLYKTYSDDSKRYDKALLEHRKRYTKEPEYKKLKKLMLEVQRYVKSLRVRLIRYGREHRTADLENLRGIKEKSWQEYKAEMDRQLK